MTSPRNIHELVRMHHDQNRVNGLPCGDYVYKDPLKIENRYESEAGAIREKFGTVANWRLWDDLHIEVRATGEWIFDNDVARITGRSLKESPAEVLPLLDSTIYEVMTRSDWIKKKGL